MSGSNWKASRLKDIARSVKREFKVYQAVRRDPRTPRLAKVLLGAAIGYLLLPFDIIPDFIPVIGHLDDALIVPGLIFLALRFIPVDVLNDARTSVGASGDLSDDPSRSGGDSGAI